MERFHKPEDCRSQPKMFLHLKIRILQEILNRRIRSREDLQRNLFLSRKLDRLIARYQSEQN